MSTSKRIGLQVLDPELLGLINASAKIFPISQNDITNNLNPNDYEYGKLYIDSEKKTYIYRWQDTQWSLIGADDKDIDWAEIKNKPVNYSPMPHGHNASEITGIPTYNIPTDTSQLSKSDVYTKTQVDTALSGKSSIGHKHDADYAPIDHNHDGRYVTPSQLATKADLTHRHDTLYSPMDHNHDTVYQPKGNYALQEHNHDTAYANKSVETSVSNLSTTVSTMQTTMANGDMHSNISVLNQLTQPSLDAWNSSVSHASDAVKHITSSERTLWNTVSSKANAVHGHGATDITEDATHRFVTDTDKSNWNGKADSTTLTGHTGNATIHVTQTDKDTWNGKAPLSNPSFPNDVTVNGYLKPFVLTFPDASKATSRYLGFYKWGSEWQCNDRDSNNVWARNLFTINTDTAEATFTGNLNTPLIREDGQLLSSKFASIAHQNASNIHITDTERTTWNGKADSSTLTTHTGDTTVHITSSERTSWNGKQAAITGGASTITSSNLTISRALVSDTSGKVAVSAVTSTELGYLSGATSSIQTQLNCKQKAITVSTTAPSSPATNDLWIDLN